MKWKCRGRSSPLPASGAPGPGRCGASPLSLRPGARRGRVREETGCGAASPSSSSTPRWRWRARRGAWPSGRRRSADSPLASASRASPGRRACGARRSRRKWTAGSASFRMAVRPFVDLIASLHELLSPADTPGIQEDRFFRQVVPALAALLEDGQQRT